MDKETSNLTIGRTRNLIDAAIQRNEYNPEQSLGVFLLENLNDPSHAARGQQRPQENPSL